jgi:hypothetical protein
LGERRRTDEWVKNVDLYSRRTPANDDVRAAIESKTAEGNLLRVRLPLSAPPGFEFETGLKQLP